MLLEECSISLNPIYRTAVTVPRREPFFAFVKETAHASVFGFQNQRVVSAAVAVFERSEENCQLLPLFPAARCSGTRCFLRIDPRSASEAAAYRPDPAVPAAGTVPVSAHRERFRLTACFLGREELALQGSAPAPGGLPCRHRPHLPIPSRSFPWWGSFPLCRNRAAAKG